MVLVVKNPLRGPDHSGRTQQFLSGIQIAVETREITARNQKADPMTGLEDITGRPEVDLVTVDATGDQRLRSSPRSAVSPPHDSVGQIPRVSGGIHVHQQGCKISVEGSRGGIELELDRAGDLQIRRQRGVEKTRTSLRVSLEL